ncbi:restriction endonuclease subunit S [Streptomyces sp. NPDC051018]|uniref:restriction endonuclease subunit S n=1 Tax=Streptomyces sp. NPDC051018 TaxID=3365639 RepID=UPI0037A3FABB
MTSTSVAPWLEGSRWPTVPIRLVARLGSGHTPSRSVPKYWDNCTVPWITLADVWQLRSGTTDVIRETKEKVSELGLANSAAVKHPADTVILSRTASVGFSAIMGADMATSQDFATWTCGPKLNPRYLLHSLRAMAPDLKRIATGSTHKTIYMPDIEQLRVPVPPMDEQHRIANFLDAETARIDRLLTLNNSVQMRLVERVHSVRDNLVNRLADSQASAPLRRFVTRIEQGASPQSEAVSREGENERAVLKLSAVKNGKFHPGENKRLPEDVQFSSVHEVRAGDFLVTRANTPSLVGDVAVVGDDPPPHLLLPDLIYRVGLISGIKAEYVMQIALSGRVRSLIESVARGTSQSMVKLRGEDIKDWPIPLATWSQQTEFVKEIAEAADDAASIQELMKRQVRLLAERRQALITAAVTGQIDVSTASGRGIEG